MQDENRGELHLDLDRLAVNSAWTGRLGLALIVVALLSGCGGASEGSPRAPPPPTQGTPSRGAHEVFVPLPGSTPPLLDPNNVYAAERPGLLSPTVRGDPALVYVP